MPSSRESRQDAELVRYLLGALPDDEALQVDEWSVVDDEFAARLQRVEDDLVDTYVRGGLDGESLARFESFYLASPRRRERVEFAKRFVAALDAAAPAMEIAVATRADSPRPRRWASWPLAAAAALFLTTGMLLVQDVRLRRGLSEARQRVAAAEQRAEAMSGQLAAQQRPAATTQPAGAVTQAAPEPREAAPAVIALVLPPQTRGAGPVTTVALPRSAGTLPVYLELGTSAPARYSVALRDPSTNGIIWRSPPITVEGERPPPGVPVGVPAHLLKSQHYTLDLFELRGAAPDFAGSYAFEVIRR